MPEAKTASGGLAAVEKLYQEYGYRARELKSQGKKVLGFLSIHAPVEIITAAGFVPFRIKGDVREPITKADTHMETIVCGLVRSSFDVTLKGRYEFLDGLVIPHTCDSVCRTYDIWKHTLQLPYSHLINVPHTTAKASLEFFKSVLGTFRKSLGGFAGKEITDQDLIQAIELYNKNRALMRELYELRKPDSPLISGVEMMKVVVAAMSIPVEECNSLLESIIQEVRGRERVPAKKSARIMVIGAETDDTAIMEMIEENDANVVMDDLYLGVCRDFFDQ